MFHDTFLNDEHRSHHTNKTSKYKLVGYKSNIPAHIWTNPGFNLISKFISPVTFTNCLKGKKFIVYRQIMILNFTRYPKSLILKVRLHSRGTKFTCLFTVRQYVLEVTRWYIHRFSCQTIKFNPNLKKNSHKLKTKILNTKLVSRSLRTVVVKLVYSPTRFV